ncbi:MAG: TIR domain-containing protein [Halobacteriota archaeon]|jgi:hypothetical protein
MAHDVFISYANEDKIVAYSVCVNLEERRIRCWIAPRDVSPGVYYAQAIIKAIKESRAMALIFSSNANKSQHVVREAEQAVRAGIPIIPFRIDTSSPEETLNYYIGPQHWLDAATPPLEAHVKRLGDAIELLLKTSTEHLAADEIASSGPSGAQVLGATTPPEGGVSTGASEELGREIKPRARTGRVWLRRPRSRIVAGALAAAIVIMLVAAGFAFLNPLNPSGPSATSPPGVSSGRPAVLGAGTLVLTASDYVSPNSTLTRGDNMTVQLYQSGTFLRKDKTGEMTGSYTLSAPYSESNAYDLLLSFPDGTSNLVNLQQSGGFSWLEGNGTTLYSGQFTWSTPFKST